MDVVLRIKQLLKESNNSLSIGGFHKKIRINKEYFSIEDFEKALLK